jgi:hypothetical protein
MRLSKALMIILAATLLSCHNKVSDSDLYNTKAAVPAKFDVAKLHLVVINTSINKKANTISVLYGNKLAYDQLKQGNSNLKPGQLLALVTWKEQTDPHWFGANIPGNLLSVEYVRSKSDGNGVEYERLSGPSLEADADTLNNAEREAFIVSQRPSVMP